MKFFCLVLILVSAGTACAQNPIVKDINLGLGFFTMKAMTLPIVVDKPASILKKNAKRKSSNLAITNLGKSKLVN